MTFYDERTALVVVDVQNDFADPSGSLYVREGEQVVPVVNAEIAQAVAAGALTVYTQDWHPPHTPHFKQDGGIWPVHCVEDTWGSAFHPISSSSKARSFAKVMRPATAIPRSACGIR